jgi:hypothetical protein
MPEPVDLQVHPNLPSDSSGHIASEVNGRWLEPSGGLIWRVKPIRYLIRNRPR